MSFELTRENLAKTFGELGKKLRDEALIPDETERNGWEEKVVEVAWKTASLYSDFETQLEIIQNILDFNITKQVFQKHVNDRLEEQLQTGEKFIIPREIEMDAFNVDRYEDIVYNFFIVAACLQKRGQLKKARTITFRSKKMIYKAQDLLKLCKERKNFDNLNFDFEMNPDNLRITFRTCPSK